MRDKTAQNLEMLKWEELTPVEKYFYIKMCFANIHGDLTLPLTIINFGMLASVFMKSYGINNSWILIPAGIITVIVLVWIGHLKFKYKFASRELSIQNKFNPELMKAANHSKEYKEINMTQFIEPVSVKEKFNNAKEIGDIL